MAAPLRRRAGAFPDNFGRLGERPTHPELLDWLAVQFHQERLESEEAPQADSAVRDLPDRAAHFDEKAARVDPENRLLWHFPRRQLEAEAIRDSMLAIASTIDNTMGGSLLANGNFEYINNEHSRGEVRYGSTRRGIYLPVIRNNVFDFFQAFDFVEPHLGKWQAGQHRDRVTGTLT